MDENRKKRLLWQLPLLAILIVGTILIIRQQQNIPYHHNTGIIFGTTYSVKYQSHTDLSQQIADELQRVDLSLSPFNERSVISAINNNRSFRTDSLFTSVFNLAMEVSQHTDGAFDITVAPLVNAWGFGFRDGIRPDARVIDSLRTIIGYQRVRLAPDGSIVKDDPRIMLDCSAIAKGYGVDCVARLLAANGVTNYMVEIGGEVITRGISPQRLPWRIGVTKPDDDTLAIHSEMQTVLNVTDLAMATSGNYRNFYYKGGKKYAHTVDPHTGYPVQHSLLSATVLAADCATADAYATAFMVMGMERARELLDKHPELMAYFIYSEPSGDMAVWYSPSLRDKIAE